MSVWTDVVGNEMLEDAATAIVRMLVQAGASLEPRGTGAPGFAGKTALDLATARGPADLIEALRGATSA